jgi:hypothetical protein
LQHHPGAGGQRDDHRKVFRALGAVDRSMAECLVKAMALRHQVASILGA